MAKTNQNDVFFALNKRTLRFTIVDEDASPPVPLNLAGYKIQWAMSKISSSGTYGETPTLKKNNFGIGGVEVFDEAGGVVDVEILDDEIPNPGGQFHQELELIDDEDQAVVVAVGTLNLSKNLKNT